MIKIQKETVLLLQQMIIAETGGDYGVRDMALLESALDAAFAGFGEKEFFPSKEEKGARLGYALVSNHSFVDGNKRIGLHIMLTFLEVNGIHMDYTDQELIELGLAVASNRMGYEDILAWVHSHKRQKE